MNLMPASKDTVYALVGTNGGNPTTAKSTDNLNKYQWNKLVGVYNIELGTIDTYINGKLVSDNATTVFTSEKDIRITFEGSSYYTTDDFDITGYVDDVKIYETEKIPVLLWSQGIPQKNYGSDINVDYESKTVTVPYGMTSETINSRIGVSVCDANGVTKTGNYTLTENDYAVYYDKNADAYSYYKIYTDCKITFTNGVSGNTITSENISMKIDSKTADGIVVIAQYSNEKEIIAPVKICTPLNSGENTIDFTKQSDAKTIKIMIFNKNNQLAPKCKVITLVTE